MAYKVVFLGLCLVQGGEDSGKCMCMFMCGKFLRAEDAIKREERIDMQHRERKIS